MKRNSITLLTTSAILLGSALGAHAAISLVSSSSTSGSATSSATIPGFSLGAGNTLAVMVTTESGTSPTHSVTFGGNAVTNVIAVNEANQRASIFYVIGGATTSGDIVVTFDGNALFAVTAISLSQVASLGSSGTFGEPDAASYDINYTGTAGGYVLASFIDNDFNNGTPTLSISGSNINNDATDDYFIRLDGTSSLSAGRATAGSVIGADGSYTETFFIGGTSASTRNAAALAAFVAVVPEPSSALLGALGALCLLRRKRA